MKYLFSKEEYEEYIMLKNWFEKKGHTQLSKANKVVYDLYLKDPDITYKTASEVLGLSGAGIYKHTSKLCDLGYLRKDSAGKLHLI